MAARRAFILAIALVGAAFGANASDKPKRDCFRASDVDGYTVVNDRTIDVAVGPKRVYRLTLFSRSNDLDFGNSIGIEARGSQLICSGLDATIIVPSSIGPRRYPVVEVRRLSDDELKARKSKRKAE